MLTFTKSQRNNNNNRFLSKNKLHKKIHRNMQNSTIINLSNKNIPPHTVTTLSKGLNYIPTPKPTPYSSIYTSFQKYRRNMYNRYLFGNTVRNTKHPFKPPTNFTTPIPDNSNLQEYISNVYYDIKTDYHMTMKRPPTNITKHEIQSLHQLKTDNDLIVKPADKGGAIVIWPKDSYLKEAYRQLNDFNHYRKIPHDPTPEILTETKKLAYNLYKSKIIDNTKYKFLTTDTRARTPHLYLLPKIHKQDIPGRPIISGFGGPTARLSQFADHLLKPLPTTTHFLRRIFTLNHDLPENIILITIDVKSPYTNIPNDQGIQACLDMLKDHNTLTSELEQYITNILTHILTKNAFTFNDEHFLQIHGNAMESPMAPTYFQELFQGTSFKST